MGDFGTILYAAHDWVDKRAMTQSIKLFAEEVMPQINAKLDKNLASAG